MKRFKANPNNRKKIMDYMNGLRLNFTRTYHRGNDTYNVFDLDDNQFKALVKKVENL